MKFQKFCDQGQDMVAFWALQSSMKSSFCEQGPRMATEPESINQLQNRFHIVRKDFDACLNNSKQPAQSCLKFITKSLYFRCIWYLEARSITYSSLSCTSVSRLDLFNYSGTLAFLILNLVFNYNYKLTPLIGNQMDKREEEKKLVDIRKELTPGNDEEGDSFDEVYSEPDSEEDKSIFKEKTMVKEFQEEERWEDTPDRQHGQSMTLQAVEETEKVQDWNQEKQKEQKTEHQEEKKTKREDSPSRRMRYEERPQLKSKTIPYDSRFIYAAYYLIRNQLLALMQPGEGFIKFNPYVNSKTIRVYAYDEKKCQEVADKVDEYINEIQLMEMGKYEAESGVQLSYKYLESLLKQNITFFKDKTQNYKTLGYYICGKVASKKVLHQKLSEIRNTNFAWIHLFRFEDTRSYRAILRKIFETPQMHQFVMEKFKTREIEVASLKRDFLLPAKEKKGVLILLTYHGQKKMSVYQEIEQLLSSFIRQTFAVFCLIFKRKKSSFSNKYTPKVDKVTMFFISERPHISATCYLYIIVKKSDFKEVRETIVKEVEAIGLDIRGRRFFRNIYPDKEDFGDESNYKVFCYPKFHPYSWSIEARRDQEFDWISGFKI